MLRALRRLSLTLAVVFALIHGREAFALVLVPLEIRPTGVGIAFKAQSVQAQNSQVLGSFQASATGLGSAALDTPFSAASASGDVFASVTIGADDVRFSFALEMDAGPIGDAGAGVDLTGFAEIDVPFLGGPLTPIVVRANPLLTESTGSGSPGIFSIFLKLTSETLGSALLLDVDYSENVALNGNIPGPGAGGPVLFSRTPSNDLIALVYALAGDTLALEVTGHFGGAGMHAGETGTFSNTTAFVEFETSAVPEPSSVILLAAGLGGAALARTMRRNGVALTRQDRGCR